SHDPAALETEEVQPAERGGILILLSDRLLEHVHFDIAGFLRELPTGHPLPSKRMERIQQAYRESARPAKPRRRGHISNCAYEYWRLDFHEAQAFARDIVFDFIDF